MLTFKSYCILLEDRAQKTLDWIKGHYENRPRPMSDTAYSRLVKSDTSMNAVMYDRAGGHAWMHNKDKHRNDFNPLHHAIEHIGSMDPSPDKSHTQWLVGQYDQGKFRAEDKPRVHDVMNTFMQNKKKLGNTTVPSTGKGGGKLESYKDFHELEGHLDKHIHGVGEVAKGEFSHPDAPLIHDADGIKVHHLKTKEASIHTRKCFDNKWCTARNDAHNMHDEYDEQGPLYHVHTPDGKHWQFHFESGSFADKDDKMHSPEDLVQKYPGLAKVQEFRKQKLSHSIHFTENQADKDKLINYHFTDIFARNHIDEDDVGTAIEHGSKATHSILLASSHIQPHHVQELAWHADETRSHKIMDKLDANKFGDHSDDFHDIADTLARHKHPSMMKRMAEHDDPHIRAMAIVNGSDKYKDKLINDPSSVVRQSIATHGNEAHHDVLVHDDNPHVRAAVAANGLRRHHDILYKDKNAGVQEQVVHKTNVRHHLEYIKANPASSHAELWAEKRLERDTSLK